MEFRTKINIAPSDKMITYNDPVMFIGSCFALSIGKQFETGHLPVMINPSGTVFNPASVCNTIDLIVEGREYGRKDLYDFNGSWISFNHYTDFSARDPDIVLNKINKKIAVATEFLRRARFLFVTFGTARIYRLKSTGKIVSNCHKLPSGLFSQELLSVREIVDLWGHQLDILKSVSPGLTTVFTISPVRHWKDGAHGNQVSKSVLFLAVEELLKHNSSPHYFPAYELLMDDLRDYRFYEDDMLHPSSVAIDYIWEKFRECYFEPVTQETWKEAASVTRGFNHIIRGMNPAEIKKFSTVMLGRISALEKRIPAIDFSGEKEYFNKIV